MACKKIANMKKRTILIVAPSLRVVGGQAVQAAELRTRFDQEGFRVHFLPTNPMLPGILGILQQFKYIRTLITFPFYLLTLVWSIPRVDVLHLFSASYSSFLLAPAPGALLGKLFRKRVILNYHSGEADDHLARSAGIVQFVLSFADLLVVPSNFLDSVFAKYGIHSEVVPNIIDENKFKFKMRNKFKPRFLVSRNLEPLYNIECALRAFSLIQDKFAEATLTILGSGSMESRLRELTCAMNLRNVNFAGMVGREQIDQYYDQNDFFINSSNIDNLPLSILEAFASGLPVISTEAGGIPFIVEHGKNGFLTPLNDHKALAKYAIKLVQNPELAQSISRSAYSDFSKKYAWNVVRNQWLKVYGV